MRNINDAPAGPASCGTIAAMGGYDVIVGAGTLRSTTTDAVVFPHRWTEVDLLLADVDSAAEIPKSIRAGAPVHRVRR